MSNDYNIPRNLLSTNSKLEKSVTGFMILGLQMAPHKLSGYNVCANASAGCASACLFTAGRGAMSNVRKGRINRTIYFFKARLKFLAQLDEEVASAERKAKKNSVKLAMRLNTISDIPWEKVKVRDGQTIFELYPNVTFYDYSKSVVRALLHAQGQMPANYHLTFSRSEENEELCENVLANGGNVAVVFAGKILPKQWKGYEVVNGDQSDARFLDKKNCVVGLAAKGEGRYDESGFVVR